MEQNIYGRAWVAAAPGKRTTYASLAVVEMRARAPAVNARRCACSPLLNISQYASFGPSMLRVFRAFHRFKNSRLESVEEQPPPLPPE